MERREGGHRGWVEGSEKEGCEEARGSKEERGKMEGQEEVRTGVREGGREGKREGWRGR